MDCSARCYDQCYAEPDASGNPRSREFRYGRIVSQGMVTWKGGRPILGGALGVAAAVLLDIFFWSQRSLIRLVLSVRSFTHTGVLTIAPADRGSTQTQP